MKKRIFWAVTLTFVVLVAGLLYASNMGFKLNYPLESAGAGSATGLNKIGLPYNQQTNLLTVGDLFADVGGLGTVTSISKLIRTSDTLLIYNGLSGDPLRNFALEAGEGYIIQMALNVNYIIVGSHDPSKVLSLDSQGVAGSATGLNDVAPPYHTTDQNAADLFGTLGGLGTVTSISQLVKSSDTLLIYNGLSGDPLRNFSLTPGESYTVQVASPVSIVLPHF
jgi:hypothetical protein